MNLMCIQYHQIIILRTSLLWHVYILSYNLVSAERTDNLPRIVGGYTTRHRYFPSFARLAVTLSGGRRMQCGSTYIHHDWILTASHCLDWNFGTNKIPTVGRHKRIKVYMGLPMNERRSIKLILHPDYVKFFRTNATYYDIGLLKVNNPFTLNTTVRISTIATKIELQAAVVVIGFGEMKSGGLARELQVVPLKITQIDKTVLICLDPDGRNFCSGDSGGPMYLESTRELAGVISSTYKECTYGIGIYINVLSFYWWIKETASIPLKKQLKSNSCMGGKLWCWRTIFIGQIALLFTVICVELKS